MTLPVRYRNAGLVLARASTDPGGLDSPAHVDLADPAAIETEGRAWLATAWSRDEVRDGLGLASPDLAARIDQLLSCGPAPDAARLRGVILSAATYLLRRYRRATRSG